ncbi:helix-turn-helix domain-containing protein [Chryseobacterium mulctrae]|uniref:helix-turn-helix domain-containing protein n=1 Tax=Chryseobacterium mulctrae TaxID=2576777 RepID=UPI001116D29C|nr:helix-turn-helix domain-containing protein [Chryseobacterium mulctrae]
MSKVSFDEVPTMTLEIREDLQIIKKQFLDFQKSFSQNASQLPKQILTSAEACELLGITRQTLWKWEKEDIITAYGIEKRRYYKYDDIVKQLVPLKK